MSNKIEKSSSSKLAITSESSLIDENVTNDPEEIELRIQNDRILVVLHSLVDKIKTAVCLPIFLANDSVMMNKYLAADDVEYITDTCMRYILPLTVKSKNLENSTYSTLINKISLMKPMEKRKGLAGYNLKSKFVDLNMKQVLQILSKSYHLQQEAEEECKFLVDSACTHFLDIMQQIQAIAASKLKISAVTEINREKALNKAWRENQELEKHLSEINTEICQQREEFKAQIQEKNVIVQDLQIKIRNSESAFKEEVKHLVSSTEVTMIEDHEISKQKQIDLSYDAKAIQQQYETLLAQHVAQEKKLRAKRIKVEQQLVSWLAKYDSDMSDRQNEFDELTKGFNEEHQELIALQKEYDQQLPIHKKLMLEKEEEEYKVWCDVLISFIRNHAAKTIQRWIRPHLKVILDKKAARRAAKAKAKAAKK